MHRTVSKVVGKAEHFSYKMSGYTCGEKFTKKARFQLHDNIMNFSKNV